MTKKNESSMAWTLLFLAWIVAVVATLGSLFLSDVMMFPPCTLCWYQRIMIYPLVIILLAGMAPLDGSFFRYAVPFVVIGWLMAFYHNLLQYGIIPDDMSPCMQGIPCSVKYMDMLGFITIPMMSLVAFTLIAVLLFVIKMRT
jgi:disulfide bond formation protein DsbB